MGFIPLNHSIKLYVPSTKLATPIAEDEFAERVDLVASKFSSWFGGSSITAIKGYYEFQNQTTGREDIQAVSSFCTAEQLAEKWPQVLELAYSLLKEWEQESILVEKDGQGGLIL